MDEEEARQKGYDDGLAEKKYRREMGIVGDILEAISGTHFDPPSEEELYEVYKEGFYEGFED